MHLIVCFYIVPPYQQAISINCAMGDMFASYRDRTETAEELANQSEARMTLLTDDLQRVREERDVQLVSFRQLEEEKAKVAAELAAFQARHARELEDIEFGKREAIQARDAEISRLTLITANDYRKHVKIFLNTQGCSAYVTKKGSPAFQLGYTALGEFVGEGNVYTSSDHDFMSFVASRQAKKAMTDGGIRAPGAPSSSREIVSWDGDGEYGIPLDDLLSYDRSFAGGKDAECDSDDDGDDAEGGSEE